MIFLVFCASIVTLEYVLRRQDQPKRNTKNPVPVPSAHHTEDLLALWTALESGPSSAAARESVVPQRAEKG
jgi:hypothetical protein